MYSIDLNSDMGESFGAYKIGGDEEIIKYVTTANVACGWHAGDPMVMDKVVRMAKERGVMVGAHPGYPDMMGFGRRKMVLSHDEIKNLCKISDRSACSIYEELWNEITACGTSRGNGKCMPV